MICGRMALSSPTTNGKSTSACSPMRSSKVETTQYNPPRSAPFLEIDTNLIQNECRQQVNADIATSKFSVDENLINNSILMSTK